MDSKCFLTSTDLQTRGARCQHQLSFLSWSSIQNIQKRMSVLRAVDSEIALQPVSNFCVFE